MGVDESFLGLPVLFNETHDAGMWCKMPEECTKGDRCILDDPRRQVYSWNEHRDHSLGYQGIGNATGKVHVGGSSLDLYSSLEFDGNISVAIDLDISPNAQHRRGADEFSGLY
jgi:hypothetical protein